MVISHKYKFIFIKTQKTAGTSIEVFLSTVCGPEDILTPIIPHVEPHVARNHDGYRNHMPGHEIRALVGEDVWSSYFKFCVERNPWDKTISHYCMTRARSAGELSFDQYLADNKIPVDFSKYTAPPHSSEIIVDRILRYESLSEDLAAVFGELDIPFSGNLGIRAKSEYRTDRRPYAEVYTPAQAERVRQLFSREIVHHGYAF